MFVFLLGITGMSAQSSCPDLNGYVDSKNTAGTGSYTLQIGQEEKAAQTYHYSGPGKIFSVRVYGNYPAMMGGVPLRVGIYDVDASGRPTTAIQTTNTTWWWFDNFAGYMTVNFGGGGVNVNNNFAVTVEVRTASPWGSSFQLQYTGNGEGLGEDLASLAGTSTGNNWSSAMNNFNKDGDFYLIPRMTNFMVSEFTPSTHCVAVSTPVFFTNTSSMTQDSMFNTIALQGYTGSLDFYDWDFGDGSPVSHATNPSHSYATAGTYTVTLTCNIDGWNNDCSVSSTQVISVGLGVTATATSASCNGSADGSVTLTATGGSTPYAYNLNSSAYQGSGVFNNLTAGTYTGNVMDDQGCVSSATVTVTQPTAITITNIASTNSSCGSSDGALLISATGGSGTLQYQLDANPFQSSSMFSNLASGFYTVTVKDANGCTTSMETLVNDQGAPTLQIMSQTNVSCHGGNNGSLVLLGSGGSGTLQYSVNGGTTWQTSGSFPNLSAGLYLVMVKDANGCTFAMKVSIMQPQAISFVVASTPATCHGDNDGTITVSSAIGGTGAFAYSVDGVNYQSGSTFNGLTAGNYTVYVRDVASCIATSTITVTEPTALTVSASVVNAGCNGEYTGSITMTATGGSPSYIYSIDGEYFQADNTFSELNAGTYSITTRDSHGCQVVTSVTVAQPTAVTATITTGSSTCGNSNGTLLAVAAGGSGSGYTYSIDGVNFSSNGSFSGLSSGNYNIVVHDGNGCGNVFVASIVDANGPTFTSVSSTNASCNGTGDGTITINSVSGGSGTLQYSVNGSTWQTSQYFTGLNAGTYSVLVKDANGCVGQTSITITEPTAITVTTVVVNVTCHGSSSGSITVNAAGGSGTLAYQLYGHTGYQSSNVFNNIPAGLYMVVVRDAAGCLGYIYATVTEPAAITIGAGVLNVSCNGGSNGAIYVNANGGTGTLQYSLNGVTYQSSTIFTGLTAGNYTIYVKDASGCVETSPMTITQPVALSVSSSVTDVHCAGGNDGVIDLTVYGGVYPYTFSWSNDASTEDIFNLTSGTYSVIVTDDNGCVNSQSFTINQPANPLIVNGVITNASSQFASDGSIDITPTGGNGPYTFLWSNNATTEDISNITPGVYTVMITDANGCSTSGTYTVSFAIGISTQSVSAGISLYPNPAHESFTIDAGTGTVDKLDVMNVLGQSVYAAEPKASKVQVSTDSFTPGIYFVRIYSKGEMITKRVEVSK